ncbi:MAG: DUF4157 domain-containing protein [Casimicrobiaceae bacterium]
MSSRTRKTPQAPSQAREGGLGDVLRSGVESASQPLSTGVRGPMERRFGHDFADIRVHCGPEASASARALGAKAWSAGREIVFDAGRYDPGSNEGRHLIAHELAHHAHAREATQRLPGIAPEDSKAERRADRAADMAVANGSIADRTASFGGSFRNWGPAWDVHREVDKVRKRGKVEHTGGAGPTDAASKPLGAVEVRTGEDVDLKGGGTLPNMIAIAYSGPLSADSKWLQFVWFEMTAATPQGTAHYNGDLQIAGSGLKALTTTPKSPDWSIDATTGPNPFYEGGYANLRTRNATTIFDAPGGAIVQPLAEAIYATEPGATDVTFTAHFETYLIQKDAAIYCVEWQASTAYVLARGKTTAAAIGYTLGTTGRQQGLPAARKTLLDAKYPRSRQIH